MPNIFQMDPYGLTTTVGIQFPSRRDYRYCIYNASSKLKCLIKDNLIFKESHHHDSYVQFLEDSKSIEKKSKAKKSKHRKPDETEEISERTCPDCHKVC